MINGNKVPHYCPYLGVLKISHTCVSTPHSDIDLAMQERDSYQLKRQLQFEGQHNGTPELAEFYYRFKTEK